MTGHSLRWFIHAHLLSSQALGTHPPVATKGQVDRQGEHILHKLLVDLKEVPKVFFRDAEAQEYTDGHAEGELLCLLIHIDGLGAAAPGTQCVLDHQLNLGQVALQSLMAKDLGEYLEGREVGKLVRWAQAALKALRGLAEAQVP